MKLKQVKYDADADAISIEVNKGRYQVTLEITEHILVDVSTEDKIIQIEILDASAEISKMFQRSISKEEVGKMLCSLSGDENKGYNVRFFNEVGKESANMIIPNLYKSPILA